MPGFPARISVSSLDGTNGFQINGEDVDGFLGFFGYWTASAGDINGDGLADILVSAPLANANGTWSGAVYVVFGATGGFSSEFEASSLNGLNGFRITGANAYDTIGWSVSSAGDINGDGYDDIVIGSNLNSAAIGANYVVFGKASGFPADLNVSALDGSNGFRFDGETVGAATGYSVASAGDLNGDGYDDMIVGAPRSSLNGSYSGASYVLFGKAAGFAAHFDLSNLDGINGFRIAGQTAGDQLGKSVASAGDVNGDGYDDLVIQTQGFPYNGVNKGSSYVIFGKAGGFSADLDLSALDGSNGFQIKNPGDSFSHQVASAGDVNGDGYGDLILSAPGSGGGHSGLSYVVFGKASGFGPILFTDLLDGSNGFRLRGDSQDYSSNHVSSAGDFNGDGYDDLLVSGVGVNGVPSVKGTVYVVFGASGGFSSIIDLHTLNGTNGFAIDGENGSESIGSAVASAGDLNGDGYDDLIIGASGGGGASKAYVMFGRSTAAAVVATGTSGNDNRTGGAAADTLSGGAGGDVLNGLAGVDTLDGGDGNDTLNGGTGGDLMSGGAGDDVYYVDNALDRALEASGEGVDVVHTTINWTLGGNLETLILDGLGAISGTGNGLANVIFGNGGANHIDGAGGDDLIKGGAGSDTVQGGMGADQLLGQDGNDSLDGGGDNDRLDGGVGDDMVVGGSGNDILEGGVGLDSLDGGAGADQLNGGDGNDSLAGGDGNDVLTGGLGADAMAGGLGDDTFYVDDAGDMTTEAFGQGIDTVRTAITFSLAANVENLIQNGSASIDATGNGLINALTGNDGANRLDGLGGDDILKGMNGDDILIGGVGADILVGGAGADTFVVRQESVFSSTNPGGRTIETDTVNDLVATQGDRLDLSAIDADSSSGADDAFHLVGGFTHHAAEMTLAFSGGITTLQLDVDGDGIADYRMKITGDVRLDSGGWVL